MGDPELRRFLRGAKPEWRASEVAAAESKLRRVGIYEVPSLVHALSTQMGAARVLLNDLFEAEGVLPFALPTINALREQAARPLPKARTVVKSVEATEPRPEPPCTSMRLERCIVFEGCPQYSDQTVQVPPRGLRLHVGEGFETRASLRAKRLEACRSQGAAAADAEFEADWRGPALTDEDETFTVLHSAVFVREAPSANAPKIGILQQGELIQVRPRRVWDSDGHEWVELTHFEVLRSCPNSDAAAAFGYALIDGSHLGVGLLLEGPKSRTVKTEVKEEATKLASQTASECSLPSRGKQSEGADNEAVELCIESSQVLRSDYGSMTLWEERDLHSYPAAVPKPFRSNSGKYPRLTPQSFKVSHAAGATIYEGPSLSERQLCWRAVGSIIEVEEETFDGWAKLAGELGWVRRCECNTNVVSAYLAPVGKTPLLVAPEVSGKSGPRQFEVIFRPRVGIKAAPRVTAKLLGSSEFGEYVVAVSQTYDGWVRLRGGAGWMPGIGRESGQLLR